MEDKDLEMEEVVRTLVEKFPDEILMQTTLRREKVSFKLEAEEPEADQKSGEWMVNAEESEGENFSGEPKEAVENSAGNEDEQDSLCMMLVKAKRRNRDREMLMESSS